MTHLVEMTTDAFGSWETRWECEPPAEHVPFWVEYQTWNDDYSVRTIHRFTTLSPTLDQGDKQ